ncbi:MAG: 4Fe-4S ferredoxin [Bacillota bacterium]
MAKNVLINGYPSIEEIKEICGYPTEERFARGPVAVVECVQEIPCNPCEAACKTGALVVGEPITNIPVLKEELCTGCGLCIAQCSGLAVFVIDKTYNQTEAAVSFPHEYHPLPEKGQEVYAVNRAGEEVCRGRVLRINNSKKNEGTPVITIAIPKEYADEVRGIKRLNGGL